jgi:hypothetical protein
MEWFRSRAEAKVVIEAWRKHFNEVRPHSSLGYLTPAEFAAKLQHTNAAPASATGRGAKRGLRAPARCNTVLEGTIERPGDAGSSSLTVVRRIRGRSAGARRRTQGRKPPVLSPIALEAVQRIDALFDIERSINGLPAEQRLAVRRDRSPPLVSALEAWMRNERSKLSRHSDVAGAMEYMLKRWTAFTRFLEDGRGCLTDNEAE